MNRGIILVRNVDDDVVAELSKVTQTDFSQALSARDRFELGGIDEVGKSTGDKLPFCRR